MFSTKLPSRSRSAQRACVRTPPTTRTSWSGSCWRTRHSAPCPDSSTTPGPPTQGEGGDLRQAVWYLLQMWLKCIQSIHPILLKIKYLFLNRSMHEIAKITLLFQICSACRRKTGFASDHYCLEVSGTKMQKILNLAGWTQKRAIHV